LTTGAALGCLLAATAGAQEKQKEKVKSEGPVVVVRDDVIGVPPPLHQTFVRSEGGGDTFVFVSSEMAIDGKVVKGAPYSAEAVTETTQTLADGNRIVRKNTAQVYRDGEGRTRREQTIGAIGPFASAGDPVQTVFIHDPVAGTSYILDPRTHTARKGMVKFSYVREPKGDAEARAKAEADAQAKGAPDKAAGERIAVERAASDMAQGRVRTGGAYVFSAPVPPPPGGPAGDVMFYSNDGPEPKVESLGTREIEGVQAEGRRSTLTIPAGQIGNDRPIEIVSERWYSEALQVVVLSKHSDPRMGEHVYRLTNIKREEPARSLFEVPADYQVQEGGFGRRPRGPRQQQPNEN
jgi:hypothetical protein